MYAERTVKDDQDFNSGWNDGWDGRRSSGDSLMYRSGHHHGTVARDISDIRKETGVHTVSLDALRQRKVRRERMRHF